MSDGVIGIIGLIILIVVFWQISRAKDFLNKKANQKVFARKGHREGQELVSQRLEFSAHACAADLMKVIHSTVKVAPHVPPVIADAHIVKAADKYVIYGYGNKLNSKNFLGLLQFDDTDAGVQGSWEIRNWTLADGIVMGQSVMKRLTTDISTAIRTVDPQAHLRVVQGSQK